MAKRLVKISLATKFRLLFGMAVAGIIAAALVLPWYFTELLAEQGVQSPGAELTRLRLNEWVTEHPENPAAARDAGSRVVALHLAGAPEGEVRSGPSFIVVPADPDQSASEDPTVRQAIRRLRENPEQELAIFRTEDDQGRPLYRCFRAVRMESTCMACHGSAGPVEMQFSPGQLVGVIDVGLPPSAASGPLVWWTRGAFIAGGALAAMLAFLLFTIITQRLVLRPVRQLQGLADKVTEGDLSQRSTIETADELQRLGDSFNEMLEAITEQTDKLRRANQALDTKLNDLAEANVSLYQANQVKSEFLADIAHELRTPLNSIIGFADLVANNPEEKIGRYGKNISVAAKNLLNMINDMLDLAKIEAGRAEVNYDRVSVTDTCQTLLALIQPLADKKRLALSGRLDEDVPLIVTDGGKLQQILYNLLSNAVKFTPVDGEVVLTTEVSSRTAQGEPREVAIHVSDSGPGIPESEQQNIFEKFYQLDRTLTREASGTGLGLAISRELANLLGGRLSMTSAPGQGATFTVTLPVIPQT